MSQEALAVLDRLEAAMPPDVLNEVAVLRVARMHHKRLRLFHARPSSPARAPHYLAFVRQQGCAFCSAPPPSEAHHYGPRGVGQKTDDYRTIPLCLTCHSSQHGLRGPDEVIRIQAAIIDQLVQYLRVVEQR